MFVIALQLILQTCTVFSNIISSRTPFQTLTPFSISGNKWLAVVFQCLMGNYRYMLLADKKPIINRNKPKLVLMWHSFSSRFFIYHFNTNIGTRRSGVLFRKVLHWKLSYLDKIVKTLFTHAAYLWNSRSYLLYYLSTTMHFTQIRVMAIAIAGSGGKLKPSTTC